MSQYIASARAWLASIDPAAPAAALVLLVFGTIYLLRRFAPGAWLWITRYVPLATQIEPNPVLAAIGKLLQALPGAAYGAAVSALAQGLSVKTALQGVAAGFAAAVVHEVMASYSGKVAAPKPPSKLGSPPLSVVGALLLCLAFALCSCSLFASKLPAAEACAPTPSALLSQVADILAAGGDYTTALEQLALKDSESVVVCAVEAFLGNAKAGASAGDASAERARAYLKSKGVQ